MTTEPTVHNTWGAAMIGLIASSIVYGITIHQLYFYYTHYPNDTWVLKLLAWSAWVIDTISFILVCNAMYGYLVRDMFNPENRLFVNRSLDVDPALMGLLALLTHSYLGLRVWKVCQRNFWFGCLLSTLSLSAFSLAIAGSVLSFRFRQWAEMASIKWIALAGTLLVVILDVLIATVLCTYLLLQKIEGRGMRIALRRIVVLAINTGLVSSVMSMFNIVTFFAFPKTLIFLGANFLFTKVYANALLANLNARESLRGRGYSRDGTISVNWSALRTKYDELLVLNEREDGNMQPRINFEFELSPRSPFTPFAITMSSESNADETLENSTPRPHSKV